MRKKLFFALALALGCLSFAAHAHEGDTHEAAEAAAPEVVDLDTAAAAEETVSVTPVDVWWGNRSISYGNYIKFDKFAGECDHWCPVCAAQNICCPVGCPCTGGCTCCAERWDKIFFDKNKAFLRADAIQECQRVLEYLQRNPMKGVVIEGKANDSKSDEQNLALASRRADTVKNWLVSNGIEATRIITKSSSESPPDSVQDQIMGRRVIVEANAR